MPTEQFTDAIALLKADHRKVEELFAQFETARPAAQGKIAQQICNELKIHAMIEDEIFYPALRGKIEKDTLNEAYVEHDSASVLVNDILASSPDDDYFEAKVTVLAEEVKHHVREEEMRGEGMFAQAREAGIDLVELRDRLLARKNELMAQAESQGLPPAPMQVIAVQAA